MLVGCLSIFGHVMSENGPSPAFSFRILATAHWSSTWKHVVPSKSWKSHSVSKWTCDMVLHPWRHLKTWTPKCHYLPASHLRQQTVIHDNSSMADASVGKVRWFEHVLTFSGYLVGYDSCIQFPPAFMLVRCSVRLGHRIDSTKTTLKPRGNREQRNIIDIQR